jgi:hypothetical protein
MHVRVHAITSKIVMHGSPCEQPPVGAASLLLLPCPAPPPGQQCCSNTSSSSSATAAAAATVEQQQCLCSSVHGRSWLHELGASAVYVDDGSGCLQSSRMHISSLLPCRDTPPGQQCCKNSSSSINVTQCMQGDSCMLLGAGAAYWVVQAGAAYGTSCKLACSGEPHNNASKRSLANNTVLLYMHITACLGTTCHVAHLQRWQSCSFQL